MAQVAEQGANEVIITEDNPREETFEAINADILAGFTHTSHKHWLAKRSDAISYALSLANSGDTVILAGKGHETYIERQGERTSFDERIMIAKHYEQEHI